jgi:hypothetical protein
MERYANHHGKIEYEEDSQSLTMTPSEPSQDPRIVRTGEGWTYVGTHHWNRFECRDPDCAAIARKRKAHYHRVHDPNAPMSEEEMILRVRACTKPDCPNRHPNPECVHYHQGPIQDAHIGNVIFINLKPMLQNAFCFQLGSDHRELWDAKDGPCDTTEW